MFPEHLCFSLISFSSIPEYNLMECLQFLLKRESYELKHNLNVTYQGQRGRSYRCKSFFLRKVNEMLPKRGVRSFYAVNEMFHYERMRKVDHDEP